MKNDMNMKTIKTWALLIAGLLLTASCANDDVAQKDTDTDNGTDKNLTTFVSGAEPNSRTSMDYSSSNFYWEADDYIYVQDDDGAWQKSSNAPKTKTAYFNFTVPGKFKNKTSYKVYYPGKNGNKDQVTIPAAQTQTAPNTTTHFGVSGDCGTATANKVPGKKMFSFMLDHQAAILVFQPYTSNTIFQNCYLTKIEVTSDNDIAATYTLDPTNGLTGTGTGKQIVLTTKGSGTYANGFPLNTTSASVATNGAYMVIKPGVHKLRVRYWVKDLVTGIEGTITKASGAFNYVKNTYYDMAANFDIRAYDGDHYYQWDATDGEHYWKGHEWNKPGYVAGVDQPTVFGSTGSACPQNNSDPRWYNEGSGAIQATHSCASLPNANELSWYCVYGDPRWDGDELWTLMGHLYKGGMWFRKKSALIADGHYNTEISADGTTDLHTTYKYYENYNSSINSGLPSAADAANYFYLPTLGICFGGQLYRAGNGYYWSSSASPENTNGAYFLCFDSNHLNVYNCGREFGYWVGGVE